MKTSKNARRLFSTRDNHALSDVGHLMEPVARRLLGEPNSKLSKPPRELRFGNHGSLSVDLTRACFFDHERGVGGGVLDLIKHKLGCDHAGAVSYLRSQNFLNLLRPTSRRRIPAPRPGAHSDHIDHTPRALDIWREAGDPRGTLVEQYLVSERGLQLADDIAGDVIRFHPALYYEGTRVGGMVALFRDIVTNEPCGIHRTFLDGAGRKLGRKMLGGAGGAAIKLDADEDVTLGLFIGEGVETCLAAWLAGFRPVWALGSANAIARFPVLQGIEALTILGEVGDGGANSRAAQHCAARWIRAQREALLVVPLSGDDLNDVWRKVA